MGIVRDYYAWVDAYLGAPAFSDTKTKFDMDTMYGRTRYWAEAINPILLFKSDEGLKRDQALLASWKKGEKVAASNAEMWRARRAVEQCIHPTTGDVIPAPFRMCAFLPMNFFIVPFMMMPSTVMSVPRTLFIQWFNQSYNSAVNYANRSSDKQPMSELMKAYSAAVVVACGGSLGATALLKKVPTGTTAAMLIRATLPFTAVSAAAMVNLSFMRKNEWMPGAKGINVKDEDGQIRGTSTAAGRDSLAKCSATRIIWNLPSMVIPTLLMVPLMRFRWIASHSVPAECSLQILGLTVGVPPALAAYNLTQTMKPDQLEPEFQALKRKNGKPVELYTYYKGL